MKERKREREKERKRERGREGRVGKCHVVINVLMRPCDLGVDRLGALDAISKWLTDDVLRPFTSVGRTPRARAPPAPTDTSNLFNPIGQLAHPPPSPASPRVIATLDGVYWIDSRGAGRVDTWDSCGILEDARGRPQRAAAPHPPPSAPGIGASHQNGRQMESSGDVTRIASAPLLLIPSPHPHPPPPSTVPI